MSFAVIGYGYWGPNIVRNLISKKYTVDYVIDIDEKRCKAVREEYPQIKTDTDMDVALNDPNVTATIIVLPVRFHYETAKKALMKGKHVLIEKPLAASTEESMDLITIAEKNNLTLMVDHTYLYSSSIMELKNILKNNKSKVSHIESNRSNLGLFRNDVNVIWDLAPHDLSIIEYLTDERPKAVSAVGQSHNENGIVDTAYISLIYEDFTAGVKISWISPRKERKMEIVTDNEMIVFDDLHKEEKIELYSSGFRKEGNNIVCWNNGMNRIATNEKEPLSSMIDDFNNSIKESKEPISNSIIGLDIVRVLESANKSLINNGIYTDIKYD